MPIVILLDVSISMSRTVPQDTKTHTRSSLAAAGINTILDHLTAQSRLEFVCLMVFSSLYDVVIGFTRDYDSIRQKLRHLEDFDKAFLENALAGACHLIPMEWGHQTHTHIILITDGCSSFRMSAAPPLAVNFPCTLHVLCITSPNDAALVASTPIYRQLMDTVSNGSKLAPGLIYLPDQPLSSISSTAMFRRFCNEQLAVWRGTIRCGALESRIILTPAPLPNTHVTDFEIIKLTMTNTLEICGFVPMQDIGSPMALSRHLVLPVAPLNSAKASASGKSESEMPATPEEDVGDAGKIPNFCVLLHGALKVENMAGLVQLGEDWYGFMHSWADSKKKSNLMLSVLPLGDDAVPWLGLLSQLGPCDLNDQAEVFPVRVQERRSYASSSGAGGSSAWVHPAGLQTDLHKLLRHARKLPDKTHHFYKEVNRVRRAALALGWVEALEAVAAVLKREATTMQQPGAAGPLTIAALHLLNTTDPKCQLPLS